MYIMVLVLIWFVVFVLSNFCHKCAADFGWQPVPIHKDMNKLQEQRTITTLLMQPNGQTNVE